MIIRVVYHVIHASFHTRSPPLAQVQAGLHYHRGGLLEGLQASHREATGYEPGQSASETTCYDCCDRDNRLRALLQRQPYEPCKRDNRFTIPVNLHSQRVYETVSSYLIYECRGQSLGLRVEGAGSYVVQKRVTPRPPPPPFRTLRGRMGPPHVAVPTRPRGQPPPPRGAPLGGSRDRLVPGWAAGSVRQIINIYIFL